MALALVFTLGFNSLWDYVKIDEPRQLLVFVLSAALWGSTGSVYIDQHVRTLDPASVIPSRGGGSLPFGAKRYQQKLTRQQTVINSYWPAGR